MHKGLHHVRIVREGARPWEIGCPYCSFIELQKNKENSKTKGGKTSRKTGAKSKSKKTAARKGNKGGLTDIAGIGDAIAKQLQSAGIKTRADLAAADAEELSGKLAKVSKKRIIGWQSIV
jgi:DNA topoisomerase-1